MAYIDSSSWRVESPPTRVNPLRGSTFDHGDKAVSASRRGSRKAGK